MFSIPTNQHPEMSSIQAGTDFNSTKGRSMPQRTALADQDQARSQFPALANDTVFLENAGVRRCPVSWPTACTAA